MGVARFIDLSKCVKNNKIFDVFKLMIPSDDINSTFSHSTGDFQKNVFPIIKSDF